MPSVVSQETPTNEQIPIIFEDYRYRSAEEIKAVGLRFIDKGYETIGEAQIGEVLEKMEQDSNKSTLQLRQFALLSLVRFLRGPLVVDNLEIDDNGLEQAKADQVIPTRKQWINAQTPENIHYFESNRFRPLRICLALSGLQFCLKSLDINSDANLREKLTSTVIKMNDMVVAPYVSREQGTSDYKQRAFDHLTVEKKVHFVQEISEVCADVLKERYHIEARLNRVKPKRQKLAEAA